LFIWPGLSDGLYVLLGLSFSFAFLRRGVREIKEARRWTPTWGITDSLASLVFFELALRFLYSVVIPPTTLEALKGPTIYDAVAVLPFWIVAFLVYYAFYETE
jgi:hypothetical protein